MFPVEELDGNTAGEDVLLLQPLLSVVMDSASDFEEARFDDSFGQVRIAWSLN